MELSSEGIQFLEQPGIPLGTKVVFEYALTFKGAFAAEIIQADELMIYNGWMLFYRNNDEVFRAAESEVRSMKRRSTGHHRWEN